MKRFLGVVLSLLLVASTAGSQCVLRQSTADVFSMGPFVDRNDGRTPETGLATDVTRLSKDGAAFAAGPALGTHDENGYYPITLSSAHTDTLGLLIIGLTNTSVHLPRSDRCRVITAQVYDSLYAGADVLQVDTTQMSGDATSLGDLKDFADEGYDPATNKVQGVVLTDTLAGYTSNTTGVCDSGSTTTCVDTERSESGSTYWPDQWIRFTDGTLTGQVRLISAFDPGTDTLTFAKALTTAVVTHAYEIVPAAEITGASAPTVVQIREEMDSNSVDLDAIQTDIATVQTEADKIALADAGAGAAGSLIEEVENRSTHTRDDVTGGAYPLDTDVNGRMRHVVGTDAGELYSVAGKVPSIFPLDRSAFSLDTLPWTATSGSTTTLADTDGPMSGGDDHYNGYWLYLYTGNNAGLLPHEITDYDSGTKEFTVYPAWPGVISAGDSYILLHGEPANDGIAFGSIPWNTDWDPEVESEVNDALVVLKLDHLIAVADDDAPVNGSIIADMVDWTDPGDWSNWLPATESLKAIRNKVNEDLIMKMNFHNSLLLQVDDPCGSCSTTVFTDATLNALLEQGWDGTIDDFYNERWVVFWSVDINYRRWRKVCDYTAVGGIVTLCEPLPAVVLANAYYDFYELPTATGADMTSIPWNPDWDVEAESECNDAMVALHVDHLLAVDYDPASKPGVATALLNEVFEDDGGVSRYTANALEQAPSAGTNPNVLVDTTIAVRTSQTVFTLTAGPDTVDGMDNSAVVVFDASDSDEPSATHVIASYTPATREVTLDSSPAFTTLAGDGVKIFVTAPGTTAPTVAQVADGVLLELVADHSSTSGSVAEKLALITTDGVTIQTTVLEGGLVEITRGSAYLAADALALTWTFNTPANLTGVTGDLVVYELNTTVPFFTTALTIVTPTPDPKEVTADLTSVETTAFVAATTYRYALEFTFSAPDKVVLIKGRLNVTD